MGYPEYKITKTRNWQTGGNKLVKKYVADLFQTGTDAPIEKVLFNNTDVAFTYEYIQPGVDSILGNNTQNTIEITIYP